MTLHPPLYMQAAEGDTAIDYTGQLMRLAFTGAWASPGVTGRNQFKVSQRSAGANMSVDVSGGTALVTGTSVSLQGTYMCISDATENIEVPAPPTSGSRKHRVVLQVKDKLYDGTLDADTYEFAIELLEDDGSGTPDLPASAINLAFVTVSSGQSSVTDDNIQDIRLSALTKSSRPLQIASSAERPAVPLAGEMIYRTDLSCFEVSDGTFWYEIPHRDSGGTTSGSAWTTYTPSLTATTSNPTMGTGATRQGRYYWTGSLVVVQVILRFGSGMSAGSGFYEIGLPVTARSQTTGRRTGSAYAWDNSNSDFADGVCLIDAGANDKVRVSIDSSQITNTIPWTWAANDEIGFTITYEAAI